MLIIKKIMNLSLPSPSCWGGGFSQMTRAWDLYGMAKIDSARGKDSAGLELIGVPVGLFGVSWSGQVQQ